MCLVEVTLLNSFFFFFYINRPIPSLLMSWQLMEPGHQQERFWWCMMIGSLFCTSGISSTCAASLSTILWKMELHFYVPQLKIQLVWGKIRTVGECMCHCTEPSWLAPYSMPSHYTNQFMPIHLGWDDNDKYSTKNYHIFFSFWKRHWTPTQLISNCIYWHQTLKPNR